MLARAIQLVAAALLLLALAKWPIGYYEFLRLVVCAAAGVLAWQASKVPGRGAWVFLMVGVALLFNPIYAIHFKRDTWAWLDIAVSLVFLACPPKPKT